MVDDREFFVSAWCWHPSYIPAEQVIFIPEPQLPGVLVEDRLPGLWYLVRTRLVAYQDWSTPPPSLPRDDDVDDGHGDGAGGEDGGEAGGGSPSGGEVDYCPTPRRDSGSDASLDSNYNRHHPGQSCGLLPESPVSMLGVPSAVLVGSVPCPLRRQKSLASSLAAPCATPSMLISQASPCLGFVGRFLSVAPALLHDGRSSCSLPPVHVDWWAETVQLELTAAPTTIVPHGPGTSLGPPSGRDPDWWGDMVLQEFVRAESRPGESLDPGRPSAEAAGSALTVTPSTDSAVPEPSPPRGPMPSMVERLCVPLRTPVLRGQPRLRRSKTPVPASPLRRSARIAAAPRQSNMTTQAQSVLLKKLGEQAPSPPSALETAKLCKLAFQWPLSDACHSNLQALLGGQFDPVAFNLNMLGLEDEPGRL